MGISPTSICRFLYSVTTGAARDSLSIEFNNTLNFVQECKVEEEKRSERVHREVDCATVFHLW